MISLCQSLVMVYFQLVASGVVPAAALPPSAREPYDDWRSARLADTTFAAERHHAIWERYLAAPANERRFVTPDMIRGMALVAHAREVKDLVSRV